MKKVRYTVYLLCVLQNGGFASEGPVLYGMLFQLSCKSRKWGEIDDGYFGVDQLTSCSQWLSISLF